MGHLLEELTWLEAEALLGPDTVVVLPLGAAAKEHGPHLRLMLYIAPDSVDMGKAARDYHPGQGRLTRTPGVTGTYSPTGIFGDATLATREKGRTVVEAKVTGILADIARLRSAAAPSL